MHDDNGKMKLTIKEDKIIDILMHTATRDELQALGNRLDDKIDNAVNRLDAKIDQLDQRMDKNFKWTAGLIIIGILVPILMHFLK